jgi:hypothetical protein
MSPKGVRSLPLLACLAVLSGAAPRACAGSLPPAAGTDQVLSSLLSTRRAGSGCWRTASEPGVSDLTDFAQAASYLLTVAQSRGGLSPGDWDRGLGSPDRGWDESGPCLPPNGADRLPDAHRWLLGIAATGGPASSAGGGPSQRPSTPQLGIFIDQGVGSAVPVARLRCVKTVLAIHKHSSRVFRPPRPPSGVDRGRNVFLHSVQTILVDAL